MLRGWGQQGDSATQGVMAPRRWWYQWHGGTQGMGTARGQCYPGDGGTQRMGYPGDGTSACTPGLGGQSDSLGAGGCPAPIALWSLWPPWSLWSPGPCAASGSHSPVAPLDPRSPWDSWSLQHPGPPSPTAGGSWGASVAGARAGGAALPAQPLPVLYTLSSANTACLQPPPRNAVCPR